MLPANGCWASITWKEFQTRRHALGQRNAGRRATAILLRTPGFAPQAQH
jgi:hypothetical protein